MVTLFKRFTDEMPSNDTLCKEAAERVLADLSPDAVKSNCSSLITEILKTVYDDYLHAQKTVGNKVLQAAFAEKDLDLYETLDSFFMSIFQSRKSRAGAGFEFVVREIFKKLDYPFSEQVTIEGAKPDFVLPSAEYFESRPLDSILFTVKRTLRERWRQTVTEANKGYVYFLATIDKKVASSQIALMATHKVFLVVPQEDKNEYYSEDYNVISFEDFFEHRLDPQMKIWNSP